MTDDALECSVGSQAEIVDEDQMLVVRPGTRRRPRLYDKYYRRSSPTSILHAGARSPRT
jgi:hypothetical protein